MQWQTYQKLIRPLSSSPILLHQNRPLPNHCRRPTIPRPNASNSASLNHKASVSPANQQNHPLLASNLPYSALRPNDPNPSETRTPRLSIHRSQHNLKPVLLSSSLFTAFTSSSSRRLSQSQKPDDYHTCLRVAFGRFVERVFMCEVLHKPLNETSHTRSLAKSLDSLYQPVKQGVIPCPTVPKKSIYPNSGTSMSNSNISLNGTVLSSRNHRARSLSQFRTVTKRNNHETN